MDKRITSKPDIYFYTGRKLNPQMDGQLSRTMGQFAIKVAEEYYEMIQDYFVNSKEQRSTVLLEGRAEIKIPLIAFTIELLLKGIALLSYNNDLDKVHNLCELYESMPSNVKHAICIIMNFKGYDQNDTRRLIKKHNRDYVDYRYVFELTEIPGEGLFITDLLETVRTVAKMTLDYPYPSKWDVSRIDEKCALSKTNSMITEGINIYDIEVDK